MGGSLRRKRRHRTTKVRNGLKDPHKKKAPRKAELKLLTRGGGGGGGGGSGKSGVLLQVGKEWEDEKTTEQNYAAEGLLMDVNSVAEGGREGEEAERTRTLRQVTEDEIALANGGQTSRGSAPPRRLTSHQIRVVEALIACHGEDVAAMARDMKRNPLQHTPVVLRRLLNSYAAYPSLVVEGGRRDFRAPNKQK